MEISGQLHNPYGKSPKKGFPLPLVRRLCGTRSRSGLFGEEMNLLALSWFEHWLLF